MSHPEQAAASTDPDDASALLDLAASVGLKGFTERPNRPVQAAAVASPVGGLSTDPDDASALLDLAASVGLKGFERRPSRTGEVR